MINVNKWKNLFWGNLVKYPGILRYFIGIIQKNGMNDNFYKMELKVLGK